MNSPESLPLAQTNNESFPTPENMAQSTTSRRSNPRTLYFKKHYKLLIHSIHIFNHLSFFSLTNSIATTTNHHCESVFHMDKIINIFTMNAIKGTEDYVDQKVTLYFKQQNIASNSIIGTVNFDMAQQKMIKIQNPKLFKKQFENNNGFIEYKFISYQSHHIKNDQLATQKLNTKHVLQLLNDTKDLQFQNLIKAKDDIIKQLSQKINQLINQGKKYRRSVSKQKQSLSKQLQKLNKQNAKIKKSPPKRNLSPKSNLLKFFSPETRFNLFPDEQADQDQEKILYQRQKSLNINVKVVSTKARQKQFEVLEEMGRQNSRLKKVVEQLKEEVGSLNVENKLLVEKISEIKTNQKAVQAKHQMDNAGPKQSTKLAVEKTKLTQLSGYYGRLPLENQNLLSVNPRHSIEPQNSPNHLPLPSSPRQNQKPKFSTNQYIADKKIDPQTVTILHKLQEQNEMTASKLSLKQEECARILKELQNCTIQLKKKNNQIQQWKIKYDELKAKHSPYMLDESDSKDNSLVMNKQSLKISGINSQKRSQQLQIRHSISKPTGIEKVFMEMKESIINYQSKIEQNEIQLMRSRIIEQTLQKQKALYENKYMSILQALQTGKEKYAEAINKQQQLESLKSQNDQMKGFMQEMIRKYEEELKLRTEYQEKTEKYKTKAKEMLDQCEELKLIETQYESLKRKNLNSEKTLIKFETNYGQMKKFVLKIQDSYFNVTKKRKSTSKEQVNEEELEEQLEQCITRLNQLEDQYYDGMRVYYELQKKQIDSQAEKRFKLQSDRIDERRQLKQHQKLLKKQAIEQTLEADRKNKRKKIDTKIISLLNQKAKTQQQNEKQQGLSILDRLKALQKRLRNFDQKLIEAPNYKIRLNGSQTSQPTTNIKVSSPLVQKISKQTKQKLQRLEQQNERLRSMMGNTGKQSITSADRKSLGTAKGSDNQNLQLKNSQNATLQMQKSITNAQKSNAQSVINEQRKSAIQEMSKGREILNKTFEDMKKQNTQLSRKKTQYEIQIQNMRFREEKIVMKSQQRQRQLEKMHKQTSDQLLNTKDRLQAKIQKIQKQNTLLYKENKDLQESLAALILEMRRVADALEQRDKQCIELEDDTTLMRQRIFNYEEAERQMISEIEQMRQTVSVCEQRFQQLFQDRDQEFVKIQNLKEAEIVKLKRFIEDLEESIDEELSEQLRLKEEVDKYEKEIKRLEETNIDLEQSQKIMSEKLQNLRTHSMEEMLRLQEQNESLRTQLIKIAQETTELEENLEKKRLQIESLERQIETLEPIYNQMCQLELKHEDERQKYQQLMGSQNQKFNQLRQKYEKILQTVKEVQQQNNQLRQRDIQFQNIRINTNDKLFDRERLLLKIQKQKHSLELQINRLKHQLDDTKEKQDHYVLQNHQLAIKNQELQNQLNQINEKNQKPKSRVHIHQGNSFIDEPMNQSKLFGLNSRMNIADSTNRHNIDGKSKLRLSRSNSRVLTRSRNKIQQSRQLMISSKQIGQSKSILKSKSALQINQNLGLRPSKISISPGQQRSSRDHSEPMSPYTRVLKQDLQQIEENVDEMKATVFIKKSTTHEIIPSNRIVQKDDNQQMKNSVIIELNNLMQSGRGQKKDKMLKSKTLEQDLNLEEVDDSSFRQQKSNNMDDEGNNYNFSPQHESEFEILINLDKKDIIERVHELKEELAALTDQNQGLRQQLKNYLKILSANMINPSPEQYDQIFPQINIRGQNNADPNQQYNRFYGDKEDFNVFRDSQNIKRQNGSFISRNTLSDRNFMFSDRNIMSRNNDMSRTQQNNFNNQNQRVSRNNTVQKQVYEQEVNKLNELIAEKELIIEEHLQQISQLTDELENEKKTTNKLMEEVENLMRDMQNIDNSLKDKNHSIDRLNHLLVDQKNRFQLKLQQILCQNLQKDQLVTEIAQRCDKLQRSKEQILKQKLKLQDKYYKYSKQYQKLKLRQKSTEQSYKVYEQQSQLQILKLNEQNDTLNKQIKTRNEQLQQLAQRFVELQNKMTQVQNSIVEQTNNTLSKDQKVNILMDKYREVSLKLDQSQQQRRKGIKQRQQLQNQVLYNQSVIQQLNRKVSLANKKHQIDSQSSKQAVDQMRTKNQQLQQHIISLKHQVAILNDQLINMTQMHKCQDRDYGRVEKQLKQIMSSYQSEFNTVNHNKQEVTSQLQRVKTLLRQKQIQFTQLNKQKDSLEGEIYKLKHQLNQTKQLFQTHKLKTAQQIQLLHQKYQFKNNDYQILKLKLNLITQNQQIDTSTSTLGKQHLISDQNSINLSNKQTLSNKEIQLQNKLNKLQLELKENNRQIQQILKSNQSKQLQANNQIESLTNQQLLFTTHIQQLQQQLSSTQQQLTHAKRALALNQHTLHLNQNSTINSLNSELQHYEHRVEQLEQENFHLKRHNQRYEKTIGQLKKSHNKKQNKLNQQLEQLEQEVEFYKAKRIDELNILLNQTYED